MFKLIVASPAKKFIKTLSKSHQRAILLSLDDLKEDPSIGKLLSKELSGKMSYKVGSYRIIYLIKDDLVKVTKIGHRSTIYN